MIWVPLSWWVVNPVCWFRRSRILCASCRMRVDSAMMTFSFASIRSSISRSSRLNSRSSSSGAGRWIFDIDHSLYLGDRVHPPRSAGTFNIAHLLNFTHPVLVTRSLFRLRLRDSPDQFASGAVKHERVFRLTMQAKFTGRAEIGGLTVIWASGDHLSKGNFSPARVQNEHT